MAAFIRVCFIRIPHRIFFSSSSPRQPPSFRRGLRPLAPQPEDYSEEEVKSKKSRNELKREARQAVRWGMDLANFSPPQIKRLLRIAAVDQEVLDAIMLVKRMGPDVREGRRRQFSYIGKLLRNVKPEMMDALIQASKDGDEKMLMSLSNSMNLLSSEIVEAENYHGEDDNENDSDNDIYDTEYEDENPYDDSENYTEIASRWFDGLVDKDPSITNEVYSVNIVEFDRQELRKLIRKVHSAQEVELTDKGGVENDAIFINAKKPLIVFLRTLAKKVVAAQEVGVTS